MNLTYAQILKLKGTYLKDKGDNLAHVNSATKNKVVIETNTCKITTLTSIFLSKRQYDYQLATTEEITSVMEERYFQFLTDNYDEITAMSHTRKYSYWGGNARSMAEGDLLKEYTSINFDYVDAEKIAKEYLEN